MDLEAKMNLKNVDITKKQNLNLNTDFYKDLKIDEKDDDVIFTLDAIPNKDVSKFSLKAVMSKAKLEDIFNGGLEQALPELIKKSGIKIF